MVDIFGVLFFACVAEDGVYEKLVSRQLQKQANVISTTSSAKIPKELDIDSLMDDKWEEKECCRSFLGESIVYGGRTEGLTRLEVVGWTHSNKCLGTDTHFCSHLFCWLVDLNRDANSMDWIQISFLDVCTFAKFASSSPVHLLSAFAIRHKGWKHNTFTKVIWELWAFIIARAIKTQSFATPYGASMWKWRLEAITVSVQTHLLKNFIAKENIL